MLGHAWKHCSRFLFSNLQVVYRKGFDASLLRHLHATRCLEGVTPVNMPSLSPTMTEGTIVKWNKAEGEAIAAGDVICEIQTDKAVVSLEHDDDGILAKILMPENSSDIKVGTLIALIVGEGEDWQNVEVPKTAAAPTPAAVAPSIVPSVGSAAPSSASPGSGGSGPGSSSGPLGPAAKSLLQMYGLQSQQLQATGPKGVLLKGDVLRHVQSKNLKAVEQKAHSTTGTKSAAAPASKKALKPVPGGFIDVEVTNMRRTIAKRLLQSKSTVAHAYGVQRCSIDNLMKLRKELQAIGIKVSVNDFLIKLVSNTLAKSPSINVAWEGQSVVQKNSVDISVAVATDNGLITPIVTNVKEKDVVQISEQIKYLAEKARAGKLQPHEFMGGSFSISNLGMFGIHHFSAIINPPQCAILAVGGGNLSLGKDGKPSTSVGLTLSYDAAAITEEDAAKFLANLKHEVENVSEISAGIYNLQSRLEMIELAA